MTINLTTTTRPERPVTVPLERLVGNATGLVNEVSFRRAPREHAGTVLVRLGSTAVDASGDTSDDYNAMGKGSDRASALCGALGEFTERYAANHHRPPDDGVFVGSYDELVATGRDVVPFDPLARYTGAQFDQFERDDRIRWLRGRQLDTGAETFVPEGLVHATSTDYFYSSSNGWACHETTAAALTASVLELVERDAVMRSWFRGESPDRLAVDLPAAFPEIDSFERAAGEVDLLRLSTPTPLHAVAATFRSETVPAFLMTASADRTLRGATRDAVTELSQGVQHYKSTLAFEERDLRSIEPGDPSVPLGRNVEYYLQPANGDPLEQLFEGNRVAVDLAATDDRPAEATRSAESDRRRFRAVRDAVVEAGGTPVGIDVTTPDIATTGLVVTAAVVPELVSLCKPGVPPENHPAFGGTDLVDAYHPLG